ncbi:hypothetical protein E2986_13118 [Frieseomelitta varia]|uniref:Uncharacterized protein n=1 Tax=Frieseomelitta varia TaxID=561572 RepID=A0A833SBS6_9HYME|nr:hypothetical protein E2986_13118 [Frieseomelitta varia]
MKLYFEVYGIIRNATRIDLTRCKLTQMGMEYRGTIAKTAGSIRCQSWYAEEPIHEKLIINASLFSSIVKT